MLSLLTVDRIICRRSAEDWESAIRLAASPLIACGAATEEYAEAMVRSVREHGPYIVIDDGLALPHARPEDGARRLCMAMLLLKEPVDMLGRPVRVLAALAATDGKAHIEAMRELAELVWSGCGAAVLAEADTPAEAAEIINRYGKEGA